MSNYLAIDTSAGYLTVLAVKGENKVLKHIPDCAMQHSVILMDETDKVMDKAELDPCECDFFCAVTGPGSFTGIRIGIATAKGFALAAGKKLLGVTAFELAAYTVNSENFYAVVDAAHSHYYVCGFGKDKKVTLPPCYMPKNKVEALGAPLYGFTDADLKNYTRLQPDKCLFAAVEAKKSSLTDDISALYVRKSQAEEAKNGN